MKKDFLKELNKRLGKDIVTTGDKLEDVKFISTGMLPLDYAIGAGLPVGRIIEIRGLQSSAKTSLALAIIANFQKNNLPCAFVDAEFSLNLQHARNIGVDTDKLIVVQPDTGEEAFEVVESLVREGAAKLIVIDSVNALATKAELEAEVNKPGMGATAKLLSSGLRRIVGPVSKNEAIVIMINQYRANIMGGQYSPHVAGGGYALKYYTSVVMELKRESSVDIAGKVMGYNIGIRLEKNKVGRPKETCSVLLRFATGFSSEADVMNLGLSSGVIRREGNTYSYEDKKLGIGENRTRQFLEENPDLCKEILEKIKTSTLSPQEQE